MKLKKTILNLSLCMLAAMVLVLSGCTQDQEKSSEKEEIKKVSALDKIKEAGEISIGTSPDYPPFESIDDDGNVVGFDIDLAEAVAKEIGVKAKFVTMGFDSIITAVKNGQVDVGISSFSVNEERKASIDFSVPYIATAQVIMVRKDSEISSKKDLETSVIAAQMGTTGAEAASKIEGAEVKKVNDSNIATMMLDNGSVDAVILDVAIAKELSSKHDFKVVGEDLNAEQTAVVIKKDNDELKAAINKAIKTLKDNGKLDELKSKWDI
jgi:polar amino acid transport system substrate-binding protein